MDTCTTNTITVNSSGLYYSTTDSSSITVPSTTITTNTTDTNCWKIDPSFLSHSYINVPDCSGFGTWGFNKSTIETAKSAVKDYLKNKSEKDKEDKMKENKEKDKSKKSENKPYYTPSFYIVKRIIKNGPAMVVFWKDGTKTVVKRRKGDKDNVYYAFCAALAKKVYGNNSKVNHIVKDIVDETKKSEKSK